MSEQATERATETYLAELETAEAEAAGLFEAAGPDGDLNESARRVIGHMRNVLKQHRKAVDRIWAEARTEARQELIHERQTEAGFRRLGVPNSARALFGDVDATDQAAMQARADELREAGVTWPGQPQPPAPPVSASDMAAIVAMQAAAAGGATPGLAGDLETRMREMAANPGRYSDEQHDAIVREYNQAVRSAGLPRSSGALG